MKKIIILWFLVTITLSMATSAELTITTNQSTYYFALGQQAVIPLTFVNEYNEDVTGTLTIDTTQQVNQGNSYYSSTNSNSQPFTTTIGRQDVPLAIGSADNPTNIELDLRYVFTKPEYITVTLPTIRVNFVEKEEQQQQNQQQNQQQQESTSQSQEEIEKQQEQQQQEQAQRQQEQLQEQMRQQEVQNQMENRLQNNQLGQNMNAVREELQQQQQEQQQFAENLAAQEDFQQQHQQLAEQGFQPTGQNLNADDAQNGEFEVNYQNEQGQQASLSGKMENNDITGLTTQIQESEQTLLEKVKQNEQFQEYENQLEQAGYKAQQPTINHDGNNASIKIEYTKGNQTATITAEIKESEVKKVTLSKSSSWKTWLLVVGLLLIIIAMGYLKYVSKKEIPLEKEPEEPKPINIKKEAQNLLHHAQQLFERKQYKNAYGKAGEAVRFYYSHTLGLRKELTNTELVSELQKRKRNISSVQNCLNLCGLVEFAKYTANKKDFDEIVKIAETMIKS